MLIREFLSLNFPEFTEIESFSFITHTVLQMLHASLWGIVPLGAGIDQVIKGTGRSRGLNFVEGDLVHKK